MIEAELKVNIPKNETYRKATNFKVPSPALATHAALLHSIFWPFAGPSIVMICVALVTSILSPFLKSNEKNFHESEDRNMIGF